MCPFMHKLKLHCINSKEYLVLQVPQVNTITQKLVLKTFNNILADVTEDNQHFNNGVLFKLMMIIASIIIIIINLL